MDSEGLIARRVTGSGAGEGAGPLLSPRLMAAVGRRYFARKVEGKFLWQDWLALKAARDRFMEEYWAGRSKKPAGSALDDIPALKRWSRKEGRAQVLLAIATGMPVGCEPGSLVYELGCGDIPSGGMVERRAA